MFTLLLTFVLIISVSNISAQTSFFYKQETEDVCTTGKSEECISIKDCKVLMDILRKPKPLSSSDFNRLKESQCGFENDTPKVCCEKEESNPIDEEKTEKTVSRITVPDPPDVSDHPNLRLVNNDNCGPITQRKIIGGEKTGVFEYPWMALLAYRSRGGQIEFRCGGSIINERYILTAAHCITSLSPSLTLINVRVGEHDLRTEQDCENLDDDSSEDNREIVCADKYQDIGIESTYPHPQFMQPKLQNDIGLIRLDRDINFNTRNIKPICLPINMTLKENTKKVIVTGWGVTESGESSSDLLKVQLSPIPNERCADIYKKSAQIWHKQMCAGGTSGKDSCSGDSGGPLQVPGVVNSTVKFVQHGVVSFGLKFCGTEGYPGVYTRIVYYLDWMLDTIKP